jgi:hypothetical protein
MDFVAYMDDSYELDYNDWWPFASLDSTDYAPNKPRFESPVIHTTAGESQDAFAGEQVVLQWVYT